MYNNFTFSFYYLFFIFKVTFVKTHLSSNTIKKYKLELKYEFKFITHTCSIKG